MVQEDVKFCMFANNLHSHSSSSTSTSSNTTKYPNDFHPAFQMNPALAQCYTPHQSLQEYAALQHSAAAPDYAHYLPPGVPSVSGSSASASSSTSPVSSAWPTIRGGGYPSAGSSTAAAAAQMMRSPSAAASELQAAGGERGGWSSLYPFYQASELQGGRSLNPGDVNMQSCYGHPTAQHFAAAGDYGVVDQMAYDGSYARAQLMLQRQYQQQQQQLHQHNQQQQDAKLLSPASASSFKNDVMSHFNLASTPAAASRGQQQADGAVQGNVARQQKPPFAWMAKQPSANAAPGITTGKTRTSDKYRVVYTDFQKVELEKEYLYSKYITIQRKAELARFVNLSERQVKIWFQNRRAKERKIKKRDDQGSPLGHSHDADSSASDHVADYVKLESAGDNTKKFIGTAAHHNLMMDSVILNPAHRPEVLQPYIHRH